MIVLCHNGKLHGVACFDKQMTMTALMTSEHTEQCSAESACAAGGATMYNLVCV